MTRFMREGYSWSGRERKCCFLNLQNGAFADVSALSGIDFVEDGRAVAATDWDGDGDLDLWMRFRTGPQLRFLRNDAAQESHFIAIQLVGKTCNRDAIGAVVTVESGGRKYMRQLSAGDGYLSQSSKWIHFGLGDSKRVERLSIRWPGGLTAGATDLTADKRYRYAQGDDRPIELPSRTITLHDGPATKPDAPAMTRVVLKVPLPLPAEVRTALRPGSVDGRCTLVCLWAAWCAPCLSELATLTKEIERLAQSGIQIAAVNVDKEEVKSKARQAFDRIVVAGRDRPSIASVSLPTAVLDTLDAILKHVRDSEGLGSLPMSLLIDARGQLQIVYMGPVTVEALLADGPTYGANAVAPHLRYSFPGRWYFGAPRNLPDLSRDLEQRGHSESATFYSDLVKAREAAQSAPAGKP